MIRKYKLNNSCTTYVVYQKKKRNKTSKKTQQDLLIGQMIYSKHLGWGTVVSVNRDLCTIQYGETKMQCYKKLAFEVIEKSKELSGDKHENSN